MASYIYCNNEEVDHKINFDMNHIVNEIKGCFHGVHAILLVGGFGRGEGSVITKNGRIRPLNDYDLLIVSKKRLDDKRLGKLSKKLAIDLQIDYVDLSSMSRRKLKKLPPSMFNYDMKYGSRILFGDETVLGEIPHYSPEDVTLFEGIQLLFNRMAGLLGGLLVEYFSRQLSMKERKYLINQINHLIIAWIDALNLSKNRYSHSYQEKLEIFKELYPSEFKEIFPDNSLINYAENAIKFKLEPSYEMWDDNLLKELFLVINITKSVYIYVMKEYLHNDIDLLEISEEYIRHKKSYTSIIKNTYYLFKLHERGRLDWKVLKHVNYPLNHCIYISLPYILFSICDKDKIDLKILEKAEEVLDNITKMNSPVDSKEKWEFMRGKSFNLWEMLCH